MTDSVRLNYNRLSRWYDRLAGSEQAHILKAIRLLNIVPGEYVLEIGCGSGRALLELASLAGQNGSVIGVDLSEGMLQQAKRKLIYRGYAHSSNLVQADAADLPFLAGSFSAIFICFTLELFPNPTMFHVLAECRRLLKPGGRLGVLALSRPDQPGLGVRLYTWFHHRYPTFIDCQPIRTAEILNAAGFQIVQSQTAKMWSLPLDMLVCKE